ncbi:MAG TPA: YncE family protein [Vicinamibacterales bacterium]|nr:YncE family protein [Vicinamibacterales bacterium]
MLRTLAVFAVLVAAGSADGQYAPAGEIHVGGLGRFDYLAVDSPAKRLYLSHGTEVVVIDTATNTIVGRIPDTPGVHGIAIAPNGKGFITAGQENKVAIFDPKTMKVSMKVDTGANPDAIVYEPRHKEIYSLNHTGKSVTVIDADSGRVVTTIPLSGVAESGAADPDLGRVYVNIEDTSAVDVIDINTKKVIATWKVAPAEEPTGMAIDTRRHRVFVGGGPSQVMLDGSTGTVVASAKICEGTDATFFDAAASLSMSACSDGHISIIKVGPGDTMTVVQTLETKRGARTMALDPVTHKIYTAAQEFQAAPAGGGRAQGVPNSLRVLVYAPSK